MVGNLLSAICPECAFEEAEFQNQLCPSCGDIVMVPLESGIIPVPDYGMNEGFGESGLPSLYPGLVIKARSVAAIAEPSATITYTAPGKVKGRHTKSLLLLYLGTIDDGEDLEEIVFDRLAGIGWPQVSDDGEHN